MVGERPGRGRGGVGNEWIGAHGKSADSDGMWHVFLDERVEDQTREPAAFSVEGSSAAVDVVVGPLSGRKGEVAEPEGVSGDEVEQSVAVGVGHLGLV